MLLRGVFVFRVQSNDRVHRFEIPHPKIPGLVQSRIALRRFGRGVYIFSSQVSLLMDPEVCQFEAKPLFGAALWWMSFLTVFKRPGWPTLRPFLKAVLRHKPSALEDQLAAAWMVAVETNDGRQCGEEVIFSDGTRCALVETVRRNRPFLSPKLVLFPHFEPHEGVADDDVRTLQLLTEAGYDTVVISTSLGQEGLDRLGFVNAVVIRPNVGHDFFSWKVGFYLFGNEIQNAAHLLLLNSSVFMIGLDTLAELDSLPDGFGCLLDSPAGGYHGESYCLMFKNLGANVSILFDFFKEVVVHQSKQMVVKAYENGLTQFLLVRGYSLRALRPYPELLRRVRERRDEFPAIAKLLDRDPVQSSCTVFREYLIREKFQILKKRID